MFRIQFKLLFLLLFMIIEMKGQDMLGTVKLSQSATVSQKVGTTEINIEYHSPLVNGRKIFGGVIPFDFIVDGKEYPWRAGSNQSTNITFSHDVKIEGKSLPAGTYGFHVFVSATEWTLIFSKNPKIWGSFKYNKEEDALRVKVTSQKMAFQEWLSYNFVDRQAESVKVELGWEETKIQFKIDVNVTENILSDLIKKEDKKSADFMTLAYYTSKKDPANYNEVLQYIDKSIALEKTFQNQMFKADIMIKNGEHKAGKELRNQILPTAKGFDMYYYGLSYYLLRGDKIESFRLLNNYAKEKPKDWIAHLALGEYYIKEKKQKKVVEHFEKAFNNAPDNWKDYARYLYLSNKLIYNNKIK